MTRGTHRPPTTRHDAAHCYALHSAAPAWIQSDSRRTLPALFVTLSGDCERVWRPAGRPIEIQCAASLLSQTLPRLATGDWHLAVPTDQLTVRIPKSRSRTLFGRAGNGETASLTARSPGPLPRLAGPDATRRSAEALAPPAAEASTSPAPEGMRPDTVWRRPPALRALQACANSMPYSRANAITARQTEIESPAQRAQRAERAQLLLPRLGINHAAKRRSACSCLPYISLACNSLAGRCS